MSEASPRLPEPILPDTKTAISLPGSADGPTPYSLPDGHENGLFGPVPVRASRLARLAKEKAKRTKDTSGLKCAA